VVEIDPETAVKFEDGKRAVGRAGLLGERHRGSEMSDDE
jgi:hypothetical protein